MNYNELEIVVQTHLLLGQLRKPKNLDKKQEYDVPGTLYQGGRRGIQCPGFNQQIRDPGQNHCDEWLLN